METLDLSKLSDGLLGCLNMMLTNYGREFDDNVGMLWAGLFGDLDERLFRKACFKAMKEHRFFPNASELLDAYSAVQREERDEAGLRAREAHRALADGAPKCHLCRGSGFCEYDREGSGSCGYVARCICPRGRDPSRFSSAQVERAHLVAVDRQAYASKSLYERDRALADRGVNPYYWPTVEEALGEDFALYDARKRERAVSASGLTDADKRRILAGLRKAAEAAAIDGGMPSVLDEIGRGRGA